MSSMETTRKHMMVGIILTFAIALFAISSVVIAQESVVSDTDNSSEQKTQIQYISTLGCRVLNDSVQ